MNTLFINYGITFGLRTNFIIYKAKVDKTETGELIFRNRFLTSVF